MFGLFKRKPKKIRVQFDFSLESYGKLEELRRHLRVTTKAEVLRFAMTTFVKLLELEDRGSKFKVVEPTGEEHELLLDIFMR